MSLDGDVKDHVKVNELSSISDVVTTELEDVDTDILEELEKRRIEYIKSVKLR